MIPSGDLAGECMVGKHGSDLSFYNIFHFDQLPFHLIGKLYVGQRPTPPAAQGARCFLLEFLRKSFSEFQEKFKLDQSMGKLGCGGGRVAFKIKCKWVSLRGQLEVGLMCLSSWVHQGL